MPRPDLSRVPTPFHVYVNQVKNDDLSTAFKEQKDSFKKMIEDLPKEKRTHRYAPGKWTIQEVLQHMIDAERVFSYRALCFARKDATPLPSFDENIYADNSKAASRNWDDMIAEYKSLRQATELLYSSFDDEQLETSGTASGRSHYVLGLGFVIVGHVEHHLNIIRERYLEKVAVN